MGTRWSRNLLAVAVSVSAAVVPASALAAAEAVSAPVPGVPIPGAATASAPASGSLAPAEAVAPDGALIETGEGLRIDWTRGVITMTGLGFSPDRGSLALRRALARQTAMTDGTRRLYEAVRGLRVDGNAYVRDLAAVDEGLRSALHAMVAAVPAKAATPWPDGSVEVSLELPLWGELGLASLVARALDRPLPAAPVADGKTADGKAAAGETGPTALVVDGRGTGSQPALAIALKDESGKLLYQGPVTYFHVPEALGTVAGPRPLSLSARRAIGATRADLTLKPEEAKRFREARDAQPHLPVVILL